MLDFLVSPARRMTHKHSPSFISLIYGAFCIWNRRTTGSFSSQVSDCDSAKYEKKKPQPTLVYHLVIIIHGGIHCIFCKYANACVEVLMCKGLPRCAFF